MASKPFKLKEALIEKGLSKDFIKEKLEKEHKEHKESKDHKDVKDHKDKLEKELKDRHKDTIKESVKETVKEYVEKVTDTAQDPAGAEAERASLSKTAEAAKNFLHEKYKFEKIEKIETIEHKYIEKVQLDKFKDIKDIYEGPQFPGEGGDPELAARLTALESAVTQLVHFIPAELRPDLKHGALKQEPDAQKAAEAEGENKPE